MERPTCEEWEAMRQAGMTIGQYLSQAEEEIDRRFGEGFAKKNPNLVGACVMAQATDFKTVSLVAAIGWVADAQNSAAEIILEGMQP